MESVAQFPPLIDGNKRTAWTLMVLMLWLNGYRHDFSPEEASGSDSVCFQEFAVFARAGIRFESHSGTADPLVRGDFCFNVSSFRFCRAALRSLREGIGWVEDTLVDGGEPSAARVSGRSPRR
jgi:hypothetical protein